MARSHYQVGIDMTGLMDAWMKRTVERLDEADRKAQEAERAAAVRGDVTETVYVMARQVGLNRYRVSTVSGLPQRVPALEAYGDNPEHACTRLRWMFVQGLRQTKVEPDLERAKDRGRKVRFEVVDVVRMGKTS